MEGPLTPSPPDDIAHGFARVAADTPTRTALWAPDREVTFGQLAELAGGVADGLADVDGAPVLVVAEDGVDLTVGVLGVLYAGAPYVVHDATTPVAELEAVANRTGAAAVVSRGEGPGAVLPQVDLATVNPVRRDPAGMDRDSAYAVALTSGSTGTPKRVPRTHRALLDTLHDPEDPAGLVDGDRLGLAFAGNQRTASITLRALLQRVPVCHLAPTHGSGRLARSVQDARVSVLQVVPSVLRRMIEGAATDTVFEDLRVVQCGGEPLLWADVAMARPHLPERCQIVHAYGSTEAGGVTSRVVPSDEPLGHGQVPVGRPFRGARIWIRTPDGAPAPAGEVGEIVVESRHLGHPAMGEDPRFQQLPDGSVRFRTGDLGRLDASGDLEHLGRLDRMVKVGGTRIEPARVEDALRRVTAVRDVVVVADEDDIGERHLVAHVVTRPGDATTAGRLREASIAVLAPSHVPSQFLISHDDLPRLPSGKVDTHSLPRPRRDRADLDVPWVPPEDGLEATIAACFAEVLGLDRVGAADDFFLLGGDSLRAARLCARILHHTGVDLPTSVLLDASTVSQLTRVVAEDENGAWPCVVPVQPRGDGVPLFVAHGQYGNIITARRLAKQLPSDRPVYGIQAETLDGRPARARTIPEMAARYAEEMVEVRPAGPYVLFGFSFGGWLALEIARQLRTAGHEVPLVILGDTSAPHVAQNENRTAVRRVARHRINLQVGHRSLPAYVAWRVRNRTRRALRKALLAVWPQQWRALPPRLRPMAVQKACRAALAQHSEGPYDGHVVLLRTAGPDDRPDRGWGEVLGTPVQVIDVPGTHDRLLSEPAVAVAVEAAITEAVDERVPRTTS